MNSITVRGVAVAAVAFTLLDILWLLSGNAGTLSEGTRSVLKNSCLLLAAGVFVGLAYYSAMQPEGWVRRTFLDAGLAVGIAFGCMVLVGLLWKRGQFFHDAAVGERMVTLVPLLLSLTFLAASAALVVGFVIRQVMHSTVTMSE